MLYLRKELPIYDLIDQVIVTDKIYSNIYNLFFYLIEYKQLLTPKRDE